MYAHWREDDWSPVTSRLAAISTLSETERNTGILILLGFG
jgi:hypothetical protein